MTSPDSNIVDFATGTPPAEHSTSSGGGGNNYGERLAALEARMDYLATKEDAAEIKKMIADSETASARREAELAHRANKLMVTALISLGSAVIGVIVLIARTFYT